MKKQLLLTIIILTFFMFLIAEDIEVLNQKDAEKHIKENENVILLVIGNSTLTKNEELLKKYSELSEEYKGKAEFKAAVIKDDSSFKKKYGIRRIPYTLVFKKQIPINGFNSHYPKDAIKSIVNTIVN